MSGAGYDTSTNKYIGNEMQTDLHKLTIEQIQYLIQNTNSFLSIYYIGLNAVFE